jgi:UDP-N-acetylglucosamine 2-epimerase (non-hydrolysing)
MSGTFFSALGIKNPEYNLEVGSGSHAVQTANIMIKFEEVCLKEKPDLVLVVGDVNSTIAAGIVVKKLGIMLAHVEAGLRSRDRTMPEEINRIATDAITDIFFTTESEGTKNLLAEGHGADSIHFVGHVMIDNLFHQLAMLGDKPPSEQAFTIKQKLPKKYICLTMHRPSNVDNKEILTRLLTAIETLSLEAPVLFLCHPRTKRNIEAFGLMDKLTHIDKCDSSIASGIILTEPFSYNDFLYLWKDSALVLTDSGGLQEETTALKIPCITMRENTERPITADVGSNEIAGTDPVKILQLGRKALSGTWKHSQIPDLWDGKASERIVGIIAEKNTVTRES